MTSVQIGFSIAVVTFALLALLFSYLENKANNDKRYDFAEWCDTITLVSTIASLLCIVGVLPIY
jgi:hypothetical protein